MKTLNQDLKSGQFKKAYLLYGDEAYLKRYYLKAFREAVLKGDEMNLLQLEGKDPDPSVLSDFTDTMPFFAEKRLVILRDTGLFKVSADGYVQWLDALPETAIVLFSETEVDKRNRLYKKLVQIGYAAELSMPDEKGREAYLNHFLKQHALRFTKGAYDLLLSRLSGGYDQMSNELEKLLSYAGEEGSIREEDVQAVVTQSTEIRIFDLTDALSAGQTERAFDIYYELLREKEPAMRILFLITRQFSQLYSVKKLASEGGREDEITRMLQIRSSYVVKRLRRTADGFTEERLLYSLRRAAQTEKAVKTGDLNEAPALEMLMIDLLGRKNARTAN